MICPHCQQTIEEQDTYLMSQRVPQDEELPEESQKLGRIGLFCIGFLALVYFFHLVAQLST